MSQTIYSDPFTISDFFGDAHLIAAPSDIESTNLDHRRYTLSPFPNLVGPAGATLVYQDGFVQSVEVRRACPVIRSQPLIAVTLVAACYRCSRSRSPFR